MRLLLDVKMKVVILEIVDFEYFMVYVKEDEKYMDNWKYAVFDRNCKLFFG